MLFFSPLFITMQEKTSSRCQHGELVLIQGFYLLISSLFMSWKPEKGSSVTVLICSRDRQCKLIQYDALLILERDRRLALAVQYLIECSPRSIPSKVLTNSYVTETNIEGILHICKREKYAK